MGLRTFLGLKKRAQRSVAARSDARDAKPGSAKLKSLPPHRRAIAMQSAGRWLEAATLFEEAARIEDSKKRLSRNPFSRKFPGGGYRLDGWHRVAFARAMAGDWQRAQEAWLEAAKKDSAIPEWLSCKGAVWRDGTFHTHAVELWRLLDGDPELPSEDSALTLIRGVGDPSIFPDSWWYAAYVQLYRRGWPRAAYAAKDRAAEVARLSCAPHQQLGIERRMDIAVAYADAGDLKTARSLLKADARAENAGIEEAKELAAGLACLDGDFESAQAIWKAAEQQPQNESESRFRVLIEGKSIAVVAPGNTEVAHGSEIDGFDLVVRTNFRSHEVIAQHSHLIGARTDITYYNGNFEPENREEIAETLRHSPISFLVLRFDDEEAKQLYRPLLPVRVSRILNPYYRMNSYAIPKIVYDLIRFAPKRIKIFNADFFLGRIPHYSGYLDYDINLVQSFLGHDVLRNIRLLQQWLRMGLVAADDVLDEILNSTEVLILDRISRRLASPETDRPNADR